LTWSQPLGRLGRIGGGNETGLLEIFPPNYERTLDGIPGNPRFADSLDYLERWYLYFQIMTSLVLLGIFAGCFGFFDPSGAGEPVTSGTTTRCIVAFSEETLFLDEHLKSACQMFPDRFDCFFGNQTVDGITLWCARSGASLNFVIYIANVVTTGVFLVLSAGFIVLSRIHLKRFKNEMIFRLCFAKNQIFERCKDLKGSSAFFFVHYLVFETDPTGLGAVGISLLDRKMEIKMESEAQVEFDHLSDDIEEEFDHQSAFYADGKFVHFVAKNPVEEFVRLENLPEKENDAEPKTLCMGGKKKKNVNGRGRDEES
jgi:hypothetical protein